MTSPRERGCIAEVCVCARPTHGKCPPIRELLKGFPLGCARTRKSAQHDDTIKDVPPDAEPLTKIVGMKHWSDEKQRWHGVVCQAFRLADGSETIVVYDVGAAATQVEIDDWIEQSIATKPWENKDAGDAGRN